MSAKRFKKVGTKEWGMCTVYSLGVSVVMMPNTQVRYVMLTVPVPTFFGTCCRHPIQKVCIFIKTVFQFEYIMSLYRVPLYIGQKLLYHVTGLRKNRHVASHCFSPQSYSNPSKTVKLFNSWTLYSTTQHQFSLQCICHLRKYCLPGVLCAIKAS